MNGYNPQILNQPAHDEVEFSLFGPGLGECAVCHLGNSLWLIVDSCIDPETRTPVAQRYLEHIGVSLTDSVVCIVATHWHDDHIKGLSALLKASPRAIFSITGAFGKSDFKIALSSWLEGGTLVDGKGLSEMRGIMQQKRKPILASENKSLYERRQSPSCRVIALSPSDASMLACIRELVAMPKTPYCVRMPCIHGNHASIVLSIEVDSRRILLGSDMQVRENRNYGWLAVVDAHLRFQRLKHQVFKIPHHGSANGDHPEIWTHLLEPNPHAVLAPFVGGKAKLPTEEDCIRIRGRTNKASITALPIAGKFHHSKRQVEKTMNETARSLEVIPYHFGHVRFRSKCHDAPCDWQVEYFGNAQSL